MDFQYIRVEKNIFDKLDNDLKFRIFFKKELFRALGMPDKFKRYRLDIDRKKPEYYDWNGRSKQTGYFKFKLVKHNNKSSKLVLEISEAYNKIDYSLFENFEFNSFLDSVQRNFKIDNILN